MIDDFSPPIGVIGGSGFYEFVDDPRACRSTPRSASERAARRGAGRGHAGCVHPAARARPSVPAASRALPREHVGVAFGRRAASAGAVRGRVASAGARAGQPRRARPGRRPHVGAASPRSTTSPVRSCTSVSPTRTARTAARPSSTVASAQSWPPHRRRHVGRRSRVRGFRAAPSRSITPPRAGPWSA